MCQKLRKKVWRRWVRAEIFRTELSRAQKFLSWVELGTSIFELKRAWFYFMIQSSFSSKLFLDPKIRSFQEKKYYLLKENRVKLQVKLGIKKCWKGEGTQGRCQKYCWRNLWTTPFLAALSYYFKSHWLNQQSFVNTFFSYVPPISVNSFNPPLNSFPQPSGESVQVFITQMENYCDNYLKFCTF